MLILVLCLLPLAFVPACSTSEQTVAFKATSAGVVTIDTAMTAWHDYVTAQASAGTPVPVATRLQVKSAYEKYQAAAVLLIDAEAAIASTSSTNSPPGSTTAAASQALADLITLLRNIGVKI